MTHKIFKSLLPLILLITFLNSSNAEWQNFDDSVIEIKSCSLDIAIDANGFSEYLVYIHAKILKEQGRMFFASYRVPYLYRENIDSIKILKAKTILNGKEYIVPVNFIEYKPLAAISFGSDIYKQVSITFPKLEIGAEIFLKYKVTTKSPIEGFYSGHFGLYPYGYHKKMQININSKLALNTKISDPYNKLKVISSATANTAVNNKDAIKITLMKPLTIELKNEPQESILNDKYATWISVSTVSKWEELGDKLSKDYFKVINQPLPKLFAVIAKEAKRYSSYIEQINFVTSMFNEKIQYAPGWYSINGKFVPRNLIKITDSEKGNCRDFAVSIAAILKSIGYKVQPALIKIGKITPVLYLPDVNVFNYVILKIIDKNGKIYWIDPCNSLSMANGIFPDIADRMALVLDSERSSYERVPSIDPNHSQVIHDRILEIKDNVANWKGRTSYIGEESAIMLHSKLLYMSQQQLKELFFNYISGTYLEEHNKKSLIFPSLNLKLPRIVNDGTIGYEYNTTHQIKKTNLGYVLLNPIWDYPAFNSITSVSPTQIGDLFIGNPCTNYNHLIIKNLKLKNIDRFNYIIDTPWIYVERSCKYQGNDTEIISKVIVRQFLIPSNELKSETYRNLKNDIEQYFSKSALVLVE
ncbi:hypothetical protein OCHUTO_0343 [Orientia chuto str. Dubai]|uniref:DUF3857 domain-containing protein n=1 Tax=Orientia chuto str. Dubai TaxID=1359168 RepID=A0A0F3MQ86_9RICK|nr:DUF3857 domain-containing protein [Candidatus Orientia mediorientalis]KJV56759.1 hypothetical protein OCHUTO_0343 [Orientia chuto str. Dubai]